MHELLHSAQHALWDTLKMLPFLIVAFTVLEIVEARFEKKSAAIVEKSGKTGPLFGALLGLLPQCGFSVIGSNFYAKRLITLGTLIAIYLSTSDEALLIMMGHPERWRELLAIILSKFLIALIAGCLIDLVLRKKQQNEECHHCHHHEDSCEDEELIGEDHCCGHTHWSSIAICTVKRTLSVFLFLYFAIFALEYAVSLVGEDSLRSFLLSDSIFQPLLTSLIGLIPNCAPSVILAQMYIDGAITFGSTVGGLCTGAGAGLLVLFRVNKGWKSNIAIVALLYCIGAATGILIDLIF